MYPDMHSKEKSSHCRLPLMASLASCCDIVIMWQYCVGDFGQETCQVAQLVQGVVLMPPPSMYLALAPLQLCSIFTPAMLLCMRRCLFSVLLLVDQLLHYGCC